MGELDDITECISTLPEVQDEIPSTNYNNVTEVNNTTRPTGCYSEGNDVYYNTNSQGGQCSTCQSICKGLTLLLFNCDCCNITQLSCFYSYCIFF